MADPEDESVTALRAIVDQVCKIREEQAREVGAYWHALRAEGVPWLLAVALVRDWHQWRCHADYECGEV